MATLDSFAWAIEIQTDAFIAGSSSSGVALQPPNLSSLTVPSWDFTEHGDPAKHKVPLAGTAQDQQFESKSIRDTLSGLEAVLKPPPRKAELERLRYRANTRKREGGHWAGHGHHRAPGQPGSTRVWQLHPQAASLGILRHSVHSRHQILVSRHQILSSLWT